MTSDEPAGKAAGHPTDPHGETPPFIERDGGIHRLGPSGYVRLTDFVARIVEEVVHKGTTAFRIEVRHRDPMIAPGSILVDAEWFVRQTAWVRLLDPRCEIKPGASDHLPHAIRAISALAGPIPRALAGPPGEGR
jgi:hypothetical protein